MATRKNQAGEPPGRPQIDAVGGIAVLQRQLDEGRKLSSQRAWPKDAISRWLVVTNGCVERAFGERTANANTFRMAGRPIAWNMGASDHEFERMARSEVAAKLNVLEGFIQLLETDLEFSAARSPTLPEPAPSEGIANRTVFIVHGHDNAVLHETARLVSQLGLNYVILREQPDQGRTIIEKFEDHSATAGFAIVLLTADDKGGTKGADANSLKPRARQNVVFELGFFIGRLGRSRVAALYEDGVEPPSDFSGVLYTLLDPHSAWRLKIAQELRAAGLPADMTKL